MKRRSFFAASGALGFSSALGAGSKKKAILELTYIRLRNNPGKQQQRTGKFLEASVTGALKRAGAGPVGLFTNVIAPDSPTILTLVSYKSLAHLEAVREKLTADKEFQKALAAYNKTHGLSYQRIEKMLLQGFESMPDIEVPAPKKGHAGRIFELRTYESNNSETLARKIGMFNEAEISIFRGVGMTPVFFGETIVGPKMPNLTYMLAFDSLSDREKAWDRFRKDPAWLKLRARPELADTLIVSNISNRILRPLPGSDIR